MQACQNYMGDSLKKLPMAESGERKKRAIIMMVMDYNPRENVNIHESVLIQRNNWLNK